MWKRPQGRFVFLLTQTEFVRKLRRRGTRKSFYFEKLAYL